MQSYQQVPIDVTDVEAPFSIEAPTTFKNNQKPYTKIALVFVAIIGAILFVQSGTPANDSSIEPLNVGVTLLNAKPHAPVRTNTKHNSIRGPAQIPALAGQEADSSVGAVLYDRKPVPLGAISATAATAFAAPAYAISEVAEVAGVTPSLKNSLLSVVAGGLVLGAIAAAVIGVSTFDKVNRK